VKLGEHLTAILTIDPAAPAVEYHDRWTTWGELASIGRQLDALLVDAGLGAGAPVACLLRTRPEHIAVVLGLLGTDRTVVTVNPQQGSDKLVADLRALRPAAIVADDDAWQSTELLAVLDEVEAIGIAVRATPAAATLVGARTVPGDGPRLEVPAGTAVQMLTSGTTGTPKRVPLAYRSLEESLLGAQHYESAKADAGPRLATGVKVTGSPLVHISGIWDTLTSVVAGRRMALMERFRVEDWVELVRRHRPKALSLVPSALRTVLAADLDPADLSSLQVVTCGTAPLEPETAIAFEDKYGIPVLITYGATEFAGGVTGWTLRDHHEWSATKRGSVGRAHPGTELRIVDPDTGAVLGPEQVGVLEVRSTQLGLDRGWVRTTDLASLDADDFLWLHGRSDDAIIRGGFKIVPTEVQHVLESHPAVREATVVGLAHERLGAVPVAAVELEPGAHLDEAELIEFARRNLTGYAVPVAVRVVDSLPRTPSLKVSRPTVLAMFSDGPATESAAP
jgi:long-chain acyl-CoA synthetase